MKEKWYQYLIDNKQYWCHGFTIKRLNTVKETVLSDNDIMWDLLIRHGAKNETPEQMKANDRTRYDHCIGNFMCMVHSVMMEKKIIKP